MLTSVFIMQPIGQLMAALVGVFVLLGFKSSYGLDKLTNDDPQTRKLMDSMWRYVIGVGTIPTVVALCFRLTIPESGRYTLDVQNDAAKATSQTESQYPTVPSGSEMQPMTEEDEMDSRGSMESEKVPEPPEEDEVLPNQFS